MSDKQAQQLAEACAKQMYSGDRASQDMGITLVEVKPGSAVMQMTVTDTMINGHDICHGGFIFALADTAFAFACNSYNHNTVASGCSIDFVAPAKLGDQLTATARECFHRGRSGLYDADVVNQHGEQLAFFRGRSRQIKGQLLDDWSDSD